MSEPYQKGGPLDITLYPDTALGRVWPEADDVARLKQVLEKVSDNLDLCDRIIVGCKNRLARPTEPLEEQQCYVDMAKAQAGKVRVGNYATILQEAITRRSQIPAPEGQRESGSPEEAAA